MGAVKARRFYLSGVWQKNKATATSQNFTKIGAFVRLNFQLIRDQLIRDCEKAKSSQVRLILPTQLRVVL